MLVRPNWISVVVILAVKPSSKTSAKSVRGSFHPWHTLRSYYDQIPPFIYQRDLLWWRLLLLGRILILGLGHRPKIWINNKLLGPRALQRAFGHGQNSCALAQGYFCSIGCFIFSILVFSPFWEDNFFMGPVWKHPSPTISFPSPPPNQTPSKNFSFLIFPRFLFPSSKIHSTKHLLRTSKTPCFISEALKSSMLGLQCPGLDC